MRRRGWIFASLIVLFSAVALFSTLIIAIAPTKSDGAAHSGNSAKTSAAGRAANRKIYSPAISTDPYVIDQWEKSIQALEKACRDRREYCEKTRQARRSVNR